MRRLTRQGFFSFLEPFVNKSNLQTSTAHFKNIHEEMTLWNPGAACHPTEWTWTFLQSPRLGHVVHSLCSMDASSSKKLTHSYSRNTLTHSTSGLLKPLHQDCCVLGNPRKKNLGEDKGICSDATETQEWFLSPYHYAQRDSVAFKDSPNTLWTSTQNIIEPSAS